MKHLMIAALMSGFTLSAFAQAPAPVVGGAPAPAAAPQGQPPGPKAKGPGLSETQRKCLEEKLGKPGQGTPPTKEKFQDAFKSCNITPPAHKGPPPGAMRGGVKDTSQPTGVKPTPPTPGN